MKNDEFDDILCEYDGLAYDLSHEIHKKYVDCYGGILEKEEYDSIDDEEKEVFDFCAILELE